MPGPRGFELRAGAEVTLPDNLYSAWATRIDDLLRDRPDADRWALELAAILGQRVDRQEWRVACRTLGVDPTPDLVDSLLSYRLARPDDSAAAGTWVFAHTMLRESLERRAEEGGRSRRLHAACAVMLRSLQQSNPERLARHLLGAGDLDPALEPLVEAIETRCREGEYDRADTLLEQWEDAVDWLRSARRPALGPRAPRRGHGAPVSRSSRADARDRSRLETGVARYRWPRDLLATVRLHQGRLARMNGEFDRAVGLFREGLQLVEDPQTGASLHARIGQTLSNLGAFAGGGRVPRLPRHREGVGGRGGQRRRVARPRRGPPPPGRHRRRHPLRGQGPGLLPLGTAPVGPGGHLGDVRRDCPQPALVGRGDPLLPDRGLVRHALGTESAALASEVNIALVQVEMGKAQHVYSDLERCAARAVTFGNRSLWVTVRLAQVVAAGQAGDAAAWDRALNEGSQTLAATQFVSPDVASMAEQAGRSAREQGWDERANEVLELALALWTRLGRVEDADRVQWVLE